MAQVIVNPGICGFITTIKVTADDEQQVAVSISTDCPGVKAMEAELQELDGYGEVLGQWGSSQLSQTAQKHCTHAACPVPAGIIKGVEVACGLALPKAVSMEISKD